MWREENNRLCAEFEFADFKEAFAFMTEVAFTAEQKNHHPDWTNIWNKVIFRLNTHDAGGLVTDKDKDLANEIDRIYSRYRN